MTKDYVGNKNDALELVRKLREYWNKKGYPQYKFWLDKVEIKKQDGSIASTRYEIKSDLVLRCPKVEEIK